MALVSFLLGILLLGALLLLARWLATAEPKTLLKSARIAGGGLGAAVLTYLAVSGRLWLAVGVATAIAPFVLRLTSAWRSRRGHAPMTGETPPRSSTVETRFLRMSLEHDSGAIDGDVCEGSYEGRRLSSLSRDELLALLACCRREDPPSARLLEAYLDRVAPAWREDPATRSHDEDEKVRTGGSADAARQMSEAEAYRILGLERGASAAEIRAAHHRLIALLHPDKGGSSFLAAEVNRAKDILLRR